MNEEERRWKGQQGQSEISCNVRRDEWMEKRVLWMWAGVITSFEIFMLVGRGANISLWHQTAVAKSVFFCERVLSHGPKEHAFYTHSNLFSITSRHTMVRSSMNSAWHCVRNLWKGADRNSEEEAKDEFAALSRTAGLLPFNNLLQHSPIKGVYVFKVIISLLFSEIGVQISLVCVFVRVSTRPVFHLDFTPQKKTTKIILWVVFPSPAFSDCNFIKVFHRNSESKTHPAVFSGAWWRGRITQTPSMFVNEAAGPSGAWLPQTVCKKSSWNYNDSKNQFIIVISQCSILKYWNFVILLLCSDFWQCALKKTQILLKWNFLDVCREFKKCDVCL